MARKPKGSSDKPKDSPEQARRRRLARLQMARSDIDMARQMCETARSMELDKRDPMTWAFHHAVVVCYSRPFKSNRSLGALGAKWERFDTPRLEANHRAVMIQRDEVIAHAELQWRPLVLAAPNTRLPSGVITVNPMIVGARPILDPIAYPAVHELCLDILPRLTEAFNNEFLALYPDGFRGRSVQLLPTERAPDGRGITISISGD